MDQNLIDSAENVPRGSKKTNKKLFRKPLNNTTNERPQNISLSDNKIKTLAPSNVSRSTGNVDKTTKGSADFTMKSLLNMMKNKLKTKSNVEMIKIPTDSEELFFIVFDNEVDQPTVIPEHLDGKPSPRPQSQQTPKSNSSETLTENGIKAPVIKFPDDVDAPNNLSRQKLVQILLGNFTSSHNFVDKQKLKSKLMNLKSQSPPPNNRRTSSTNTKFLLSEAVVARPSAARLPPARWSRCDCDMSPKIQPRNRALTPLYINATNIIRNMFT